MKRTTDILEAGMTEARKLAATVLRARYKAGGEGYTDEEGNYWGWMWNNEGKRVRVCIPAR